MYGIAIFFAIIYLVNAGQHDIYAGHTVHGVKLRNRSEQILVHDLLHRLEVDIWRYGIPDHRDAMIMLSPENKNSVLERLDQNGITHYVDMQDVAEVLEAQDKQIKEWKENKARSGRAAFPFEDYPRYAEVNDYMDRIAAQYPDIVTSVVGGQSFQNRDIKYLKISTSNFTDASKPIYFIDAMLHAREWVTTPVALFAIHRLVEDLRTQDRDLLEDIDWIILPLVNPDGYEYSHTTVRMWRKTRSFRPEVSTGCWGVDGNRNYDDDWGNLGVSTNPCSDVYHGEEPFSEPETRIVRDILLEYNGRIQVFLDMHSFGNLVLFGYGNGTLPPPPSPSDLFHVGSAMGAAIDPVKLPDASFYSVYNAAHLYPTSGSADDYALQVGVPLSFCLELPGYWTGFIVAPELIEQINRETWEGIAASARIARSHYRARLNRT